MVAVGPVQLAGEHVRADDREAGAEAAERVAVRGVAEQHDPALRVVVHVDAADRVEVEVRTTSGSFAMSSGIRQPPPR